MPRPLTLRSRVARSSRRRRIGRSAAPVHLPNAAEFSAEPRFRSPLWLVSVIKSMPWLWRDLANATTVRHNWGRRRGPGRWALAYLAFVISGEVDVEPWHRRVAEDEAFWRACEFASPPGYSTVHERFAELEEFADAFAEAAGVLIRRARQSDPQIGAWLHFDSTECETHGAPVHDCGAGDDCPSRRSGRHVRRIPRVSTELAGEIRRAQAERAPDEPPRTTVAQTRERPIERVVVDRERGGVRFRSGGHWWFSRDAEAGTRAYTSARGATRAWHGYYHHKAIDHYTGCPVAVDVHAASESEHVAYPRVLEQAMDHTGVVPAAVSLDRGYAVTAVYELNSRQGIGTVAPYRRLSRHDPPQAAATTSYDEHGVPRCRHCGGETEYIRFAHEPQPRVWVRCLLPQSDECEREQTFSCSTSWTRILPIPRTNPVYHALRGWHSNTEQVHNAWRRRYLSGGKSLAERPKRVSRAGQQLRASAALLIEWLWASFRQGWLGDRGRRAEPVPTDGNRVGRSIVGRRRRLGLRGRPRARARPGPAPPSAPAPAPVTES